MWPLFATGGHQGGLRVLEIGIVLNGRLGFQLADGAGPWIDVVTDAEENGLVETALRVGVEISDLDDLSRVGDVLVGGDGDIADLSDLVSIEEFQGDAAFASAACGGDGRAG